MEGRLNLLEDTLLGRLLRMLKVKIIFNSVKIQGFPLNPKHEGHNTEWSTPELAELPTTLLLLTSLHKAQLPEHSLPLGSCCSSFQSHLDVTSSGKPS
jgi:hypothetical protein